MPKNFGDSKKSCTFALAIEKSTCWSCNDIGIWCNGNTTDSGPVIPGSSPGIPTSSFKWFFLNAKLGYGVMVTLQILVLSFLVRVRVSQLESIFHSKDAFFYIPKAFLNMSPHFARYQKENPELSPWVYDEFNDFFYCISASNYLFSASIALIFSFTSFKSSFNFSTLRFISSTRLLPFLLAALRKPRLFS